jgi:hypothetical protein
VCVPAVPPKPPGSSDSLTPTFREVTAEYDRLNMVQDPEEEPYKSKYAARDVLVCCTVAVHVMLPCCQTGCVSLCVFQTRFIAAADAVASTSSSHEVCMVIMWGHVCVAFTQGRCVAVFEMASRVLSTPVRRKLHPHRRKSGCVDGRMF